MIKFNEDNLFEMANVRTNKTGLSMLIWISPKTGNEKHNARIKVQNSYGDKVTNDWFVVTIDKFNPIVVEGSIGSLKQKDIDSLLLFVKNNFQPLIDLWNDKIDSYDCVAKFKKV